MNFMQQESPVGLPPPSDFGDGDLSWIKAIAEKKLGQAISDISMHDYSGQGGLSGAALKVVRLRTCEDTMKSFIIKTITDADLSRSKRLGNARESYFYHFLAPMLSTRNVNIPDVLFAYGDMSTGGKTIILEDLSIDCIQSGYFFGQGSPLNWNKDLNAILQVYHSRCSSVDTPSDHSATMELIAMMTFRNAANMHATFWMDRSLLNDSYSWLRGHSWLTGVDELSWVQAQASVQVAWEKLMTRIQSGVSTVVWDPNLLRCIKASVEKISWQDYSSTVSSADYRWTLVHGKRP